MTSRPLARQRSTISVLRSTPRAGNAGIAQQLEELAAPAADVEDIGGAGEPRDVVGHPFADLVLGAAVEILEPGVLMAAHRVLRPAAAERGRAPAPGPRRPPPARLPAAGARPPLASRIRCTAGGRALRRGDRRAQLVDGLGEALIADGERLVALQDLVGQPAQAAGEAARHLVEPGRAVGHVLGGAPSQPGELVVLGVDKRRHRLQVDDQRRLEPDRRLELRPDQADGRVDGLRHRPLRAGCCG